MKQIVAKRLRQGFTLIELLIVIAIVILLLIFVFINLQKQTRRAMDIARKTDLYKLRKAFEDYDNDHEAFPPQDIVTFCAGTNLSPYLAKIPCDPTSKLPYGYFQAQNGGYRICAKLADTTDPDIAAQGCAGPLACGVGGGFNYCLTSGVAPSAVGSVDQAPELPTPTPTNSPTPSPTPASGYACAPLDFLGVSRCNHYSDPVGSGCPRTYTTPDCNNACGNPANRCQQ